MGPPQPGPAFGPPGGSPPGWGAGPQGGPPPGWGQPPQAAYGPPPGQPPGWGAAPGFAANAAPPGFAPSRVGAPEAGLNPYGATVAPEFQQAHGLPPVATPPPAMDPQSKPSPFAQTAPPSLDGPAAPPAGPVFHQPPELMHPPAPLPTAAPPMPEPELAPPAPSPSTPSRPPAAGVDPERVAADAPRTLVGFLVSFHGDAQGEFWALRQGPNTLGRKDAAEGLDIEIDHPTTSSRHAVLLASAGPTRVKLKDLGSTNGTFIKDQKLVPNDARDLADGEEVRFGGFVTVLKLL